MPPRTSPIDEAIRDNLAPELKDRLRAAVLKGKDKRATMTIDARNNVLGPILNAAKGAGKWRTDKI